MSNAYNKSITEVIKERSSIRTYRNRKIENDVIDKIEGYIYNIKGPFNSKVRFQFLNSKENLNGAKLGTYGVIKGTSCYLGAAVEKGEMDLEELGYEMESVILYATSLGLGTCWLGGTFKRGEFAKAMEVKENEIFPIITPLGYSAENRSFMDSAIRFLAKSKQRKPWKELFFDKSFNNPLIDGQKLEKYGVILENVRIAPSASNKQPWRIVKEEDNFHFYIERTKGYSEPLGFDIQRVDMGIAMCHFELTAKELGVKGGFKKVSSNIQGNKDTIEYVISWIKE